MESERRGDPLADRAAAAMAGPVCSTSLSDASIHSITNANCCADLLPNDDDDSDDDDDDDDDGSGGDGDEADVEEEEAESAVSVKSVHTP